MTLIILILRGTPKDLLGCGVYQEYSGDIKKQDFKVVHKHLLVCHTLKLFYVNSNNILVGLNCSDLIQNKIHKTFIQSPPHFKLHNWRWLHFYLKDNSVIALLFKVFATDNSSGLGKNISLNFINFISDEEQALCF